jgi:hypothetical protein
MWWWSSSPGMMWPRATCGVTGPGEDIKRHRTVGAAIAEPGDTAELDDSTRKPLSVVMVLPSSTGQPIRASIPQKAPR